MTINLLYIVQWRQFVVFFHSVHRKYQVYKFGVTYELIFCRKRIVMFRCKIVFEYRCKMVFQSSQSYDELTTVYMLIRRN